MQVFIELPGHAGASRQGGHRHWMEPAEFRFTRPLLDNASADFAITKPLDAMSHVLLRWRDQRRALRRVRVHRVEGSTLLSALRFEQVRVAQITIVGSEELAMETVQFRAGRWVQEELGRG